jgi:cytoskeletal protein CcmA (bactofilin family)
VGLFGRDEPPQPVSPALSNGPAPESRTRTSASAGITIIASPSRFKGVLEGDGDVRIEGRIEGEVKGSGHIQVAQSGHVSAKLHSRTVTVAGTVHGDVSADEKIELMPSAELRGNITAPKVVIQEGATFEGQVFMQSPKGAAGGGAASKGAPGGGKGQPGKDRDADTPSGTS